MHEGRPMTWREVAEKHHTAFIDEMEACLDASIRSAVDSAVLQVREEAQRALSDLKAETEQRCTSAIDEANRIAASALAEQQTLFEQQRLEELEKLKSEAHRSLAEVKLSFERAREADREQVRRATQQSLSETWNQLFRRLRKAASAQDVLHLVSEASSNYAERLVVLVFENNQALVAASRNVDQNTLRSFPSSQSPAVESVISSRDPVVVLAAEGELSTTLFRMLQPAVGEKVYLFPVLGRQAVLAVVVAHGVFAPASIELLCESAGFQLDVISESAASARVQKPATAVEANSKGSGDGKMVESLTRTNSSNLVTIAAPASNAAATANSASVMAGSNRTGSTVTGKSAATASAPKAWAELEPAEQKLHLQAQRFARVQVAEMRLYKPDAVRNGLDQKNLYHALKHEIDDARKQFLNRFLTISPNMVDYLHLEILRNLVHDDDRLLGHDYPGPMV